jgi:hypothetical protein
MPPTALHGGAWSRRASGHRIHSAPRRVPCAGRRSVVPSTAGAPRRAGRLTPSHIGARIRGHRPLDGCSFVWIAGRVAVRAGGADAEDMRQRACGYCCAVCFWLYIDSEEACGGRRANGRAALYRYVRERSRPVLTAHSNAMTTAAPTQMYERDRRQRRPNEKEI